MIAHVLTVCGRRDKQFHDPCMQYAAGATPVRVRKIICGHDRLVYFPNETTRKNICATINLPAAVAASNKSRTNTAIAKKSRYIHYTRPLYAFTSPALSKLCRGFPRRPAHPTRDVLHAKQRKWSTRDWRWEVCLLKSGWSSLV